MKPDTGYTYTTGNEDKRYSDCKLLRPKILEPTTSLISSTATIALRYTASSKMHRNMLAVSSI